MDAVATVGKNPPMRDIPTDLNADIPYGWCATTPGEPDLSCGWCDRSYIFVEERQLVLCPRCDKPELETVQQTLYEK